jgi:hypothetical protein
MSQPLPIIFIHLGNSPYLPYTLGQAKMQSMASPIILIGDDTNNTLPFVTHVNMNRYAARAAEFQKIYRHFSDNGVVYEQFCFLRWFLLRDFLKTHGIERAIHVDSDVLLYVDVNEEQRHWKDFDLSLVNGECAGNMFINGARGLDELCTIIWDLFAAPGADQRLAGILESRRDPAGGRAAVSDMVPLKMLANANPDRIAEMTGIRSDDSYWDANVRVDEGFEYHEEGRKRYEFRGGRAFCRHVSSGKDIWFKSLHFQGAKGKPFIEPAFRAGMNQIQARAA